MTQRLHRSDRARSLHPLCYDHNPGFLGWVQRTGLPFHAHPKSKKADLEERSKLYRRIAELIWDPEMLLREWGSDSCSHYPPRTSEWDKVEHRPFSFISINWRGRPL